ncbi:MAG: UDP-glucose 4-epimerase GalE [Synechococcales cyanobacterium CRU_2_2]|nr:UDP-glucose 4-epimerase GalE [Synechococcales cyanobacterium CRU_2_2]
MISPSPYIFVVGGAGYIGSHVVRQLLLDGYRVLVLDNFIYGHRDILEKALNVEYIEGDMGDRALLDRLFSTYKIDVVMHFAAFAYVGESVTDPAKYYQNNVVATLTLLESMRAAGVDKFVFSSTCATYGIPSQIPILEDHPQSPINPYGATKLMVERILQDFGTAYNLKSVVFRYFNAAGADPSGQLGEDHGPETHLIPLVLQTALGLRSHISIFGTDYSTPDGTCIRDYIHVNDLASAHILGSQHLLEGGESETFNLGNGSGFSVKQVIESAYEVTGREIPVRYEARRPGDPPMLIGSAEKASRVLGWTPQYTQINEIIAHAWLWHQKRHGNTSSFLSGDATDRESKDVFDVRDDSGYFNFRRASAA